MFIVRLLVKMGLIGLALPALGLITFSGGIWTTLGITVLMGVLGTVLAVFLLPGILGAGLLTAVSGAIGGVAGMFLVGFFFETLFYALVLWVTSSLLPDSLGLVSFWATMGAAAILGFVSNVFSTVSANR